MDIRRYSYGYTILLVLKGGITMIYIVERWYRNEYHARDHRTLTAAKKAARSAKSERALTALRIIAEDVDGHLRTISEYDLSNRGRKI